jgi:hypothetical protein
MSGVSMTAMIFGGASAIDRALCFVGVWRVAECEGVRGEGWSGIVSIEGARGAFGVGKLSRGMLPDFLRAALTGVIGGMSGPPEDFRPETLRARTGGAKVLGVRGSADVVGDDMSDEF